MRAALVPIALFAVAAAACAVPAGEQPVADVVDAAPTTTPIVAVAAEAPSTFALPDITSRHITRSDLATMLPSGDSTPLPRTNEDLVTLAVLDREDEASDVVLHGRETGVGAAYADGSFVWIDVLADEESAHDYLRDAAGDIAKGIGGTHDPGAAAGATSEFAVDVGSESIGIVAELADGTGSETLILARAGRVVVFSSYVHEPDDDARVRAQYLAEDVVGNLVTVLTESAIEARADDPRRRFETTTTIEDESGATTIVATGIADGADRACTVRLDRPEGTSTHDLVEISGLMWWRTGDGGYQRTGRANADAAALSLACSAWPVTVDEAGLQPIVDAQPSPARHRVNGVDASGYQSDADGLATLLGVDAIGAAVDGFSFWVADEAPWLVEVSLTMRGTADEIALVAGPLAHPVGPGTVTIRHRIFEIGSVAESIVPPS